MSDPIATLDAVRDALHAAAVADAMRALARREYFDSEEAMAECPVPDPATWDDVEELLLSYPQWIANMQARAAEGAKWADSIASASTRWADHVNSDAHQAWLRDGGPERLWARFRARHDRAAATAEILASGKRDDSSERQAMELAQWLMDEMVRLYLGEAQ